MFNLKSTSRIWAPAGLLLMLGCWSQPPAASSDIDLEPLELEAKEALFGQLLDDLVQQNGSSMYNMTIVNKYAQAIEATLGSLKGTSVLEIGPGRNLAVGVTLVVRGARRYSAVDIYQDPALFEPMAYLNMHRLAQEVTGWSYNVSRFDDMVRIEDGQVHLDPERIEWLYPHESYSFPTPDDSIDFVFSHSGFEHFNEPRKTIDRILKALRPGGVTAHSIDLRDHDDFSKPYAFLAFSEEEWRARFKPENLHNYTNRWRAVDFRQAFEDAGFEILEDYRQEEAQVTEALKQTFHSDFHKYPLKDLSETYLWIVARKPDTEALAQGSESTPNG
ncbi:MAG: methyltransferase domain-containing protein [Acidobacteriota bacterium]